MSQHAIEAVKKFISVVALCFPKPRFEDEGDEALWSALMLKTVGHYSHEVLSRAANTIVSTRDRKKDGAYFPVPSECIAACEKAKRIVECEQHPMLTVDKAPSGFSPDRHKLAIDLLGTDLGVEAVKGRWHGALYDFIYRNAKMPVGSEIDMVKRKSKEFFDAVRACELGKAGDLSKPLAQLGNNIARRREDWAKNHE
jgi:hypothetical protein